MTSWRVSLTGRRTRHGSGLNAVSRDPSRHWALDTRWKTQSFRFGLVTLGGSPPNEVIATGTVRVGMGPTSHGVPGSGLFDGLATRPQTRPYAGLRALWALHSTPPASIRNVAPASAPTGQPLSSVEACVTPASKELGVKRAKIDPPTASESFGRLDVASLAPSANGSRRKADLFCDLRDGSPASVLDPHGLELHQVGPTSRRLFGPSPKSPHHPPRSRTFGAKTTRRAKRPLDASYGRLGASQGGRDDVA